MSVHRVSVYTKAGVIAHVQSTNGDQWPGEVIEKDAAGVVVPLVRTDVELEPTAAEIAGGTPGRPEHRSAAVLFQKELEMVAGKIVYRAGVETIGVIRDRAAVVLPD